MGLMKAFSESFAVQVPEKKFTEDFLLNNIEKGEKNKPARKMAHLNQSLEVT